MGVKKAWSFKYHIFSSLFWSNWDVGNFNFFVCFTSICKAKCDFICKYLWSIVDPIVREKFTQNLTMLSGIQEKRVVRCDFATGSVEGKTAGCRKLNGGDTPPLPPSWLFIFHANFFSIRLRVAKSEKGTSTKSQVVNVTSTKIYLEHHRP